MIQKKTSHHATDHTRSSDQRWVKNGLDISLLAKSCTRFFFQNLGPKLLFSNKNSVNWESKDFFLISLLQNNLHHIFEEQKL
mgnify:CR=1 FL=1